MAHFGYRLFVDVTEDQKRALCAAISTASVIVKPHSSSLAFIKGACTVGLYSLFRAMVSTNIDHALLIGYGMKMPYADALFLDHLNEPNHRKRFDIGRNIVTESIPVFSITAEHCLAKVYPMFGNLGAGCGSTSLELPATRNEVQSATIKYYLRVLHHIKAFVITMDILKLSGVCELS